MWRWLRRFYLAGMALLPLGMWWMFRAAGISLKVKIIGGVPLGGVVIPWWVGWEMAVLAALMEWGNEPMPPEVSGQEEVGMWLLYSMMGAFVGDFFALWMWLTVSTTNMLVGLLPSVLEPLAGMLTGIVGLI